MEASDIQKRLSGGVANTDVDLSLGAEMSTSVIVNNTLQNLFDNVSSAERATGSVEYRCFYFVNKHATETLVGAAVYIASQTPAADTAIAIGLDPAGVGDGENTGVAATIADETSAPAGVSFSAPGDAGTALAVGDLAPDEAIAVWVRRTVDIGAVAAANDPFTVRITGTPT